MLDKDLDPEEMPELVVIPDITLTINGLEVLVQDFEVDPELGEVFYRFELDLDRLDEYTEEWYEELHTAMIEHSQDFLNRGKEL